MSLVESFFLVVAFYTFLCFVVVAIFCILAFAGSIIFAIAEWLTDYCSLSK
jgi:hypothetical protein